MVHIKSVSLRFRGKADPSWIPKQKNRPLKVTEAATVEQNSRYGRFGVGGFKDHHANLYPFRFMGGQIMFSGHQGNLTVYRCPALSYVNSAFQTYSKNVGTALEQIADMLAKFIRVNEDVLTDASGNIIDNYSIVAADLMARFIIHSQYELEKWFTIDTWANITRAIYENFPKSIVENLNGTHQERFFAFSFSEEDGVPTVLPGSTEITDEGYLYITPPSNSQANVTRVYINQAIWIALCNILGYSTKGAILMWEEISLDYSNKKMVTPNDLINWLARDGHNPVGYVDFFNQAANALLQPANGIGGIDRQAVEMLSNMLVRLVLLKVWQLTAQALSMEDWKFQTTYDIYHAGLPDSQFEEALQAVNERWKNTQLHVPVGSMNAKINDLYILPITTTTARGYYTPAVVVNFGEQHDNSYMAGYPAVVFNEIRFDVIGHLNSTGVMNFGFSNSLFHSSEHENANAETEMAFSKGQYCLVDIVNLTATQNEEILSYNRLTGELDGVSANDESDAVIRIGVVYPSNLKVCPPDILGLKLERRHWPMIYQYLAIRDPIVVVGTSRESNFYCQQSFTGPNYYLVNSYGLIDEPDLVGPAVAEATYETKVGRDYREVTFTPFSYLTFLNKCCSIIKTQPGATDGEDPDFLKDSG